MTPMPAQRIQFGTLSAVQKASRCAMPRHEVPAGYDFRLVLVFAFATTVLGIGWAGVFMPGWSPADLLGDGREPGAEEALMLEVAVQEETVLPPAGAEPPVPVEVVSV